MNDAACDEVYMNLRIVSLQPYAAPEILVSISIS